MRKQTKEIKIFFFFFFSRSADMEGNWFHLLQSNLKYVLLLPWLWPDWRRGNIGSATYCDVNTRHWNFLWQGNIFFSLWSLLSVSHHGLPSFSLRWWCIVNLTCVDIKPFYLKTIVGDKLGLMMCLTILLNIPYLRGSVPVFSCLGFLFLLKFSK